jgi:hypothetical protein
MSKNRLPDALPAVPVQLDLNTPGAVEKLFYGERPLRQGDVAPSPEQPAPVQVAEPDARRPVATVRSQTGPVAADPFAAALDHLKTLGPRGKKPHHVHLPDSLDIALRRFAADRKTKATNVLIVALMDYLDTQGRP